VPIQQFDFSTGKTKDPQRFQSILFMQDDKDIESIAALLRKERYPMLGRAGNLREALEMARKYKKGMFFLDADWDGVDALEVVQDIARRFPEMSVVVAKSSATKEELVTLHQQGAAGFVLKPVTVESLAKVIKRL